MHGAKPCGCGAVSIRRSTHWAPCRCGVQQTFLVMEQQAIYMHNHSCGVGYVHPCVCDAGSINPMCSSMHCMQLIWLWGSKNWALGATALLQSSKHSAKPCD